MEVVFIVLAGAGVIAISVLALRRADRFLGDQPTSALFEVDEAVEFVASALPAEVTRRLTYEDVEALLGWHIVHLAGRESGIDIADEQAVADLARRAEADGRDITADDVRAVLAAEGEYLAAIGALEDDASET